MQLNTVINLKTAKNALKISAKNTVKKLKIIKNILVIAAQNAVYSL